VSVQPTIRQRHAILGSPQTAYGLPRGFRVVQQPARLTWHNQHYECTAEGAGNPIRVSSFIAVVLSRYIPVTGSMEETIIGGCTICAILRKVVPYLPTPRTIGQKGSLEMVIETHRGRRRTIITPAHGVKAGQLLRELLVDIEAGAIVTIIMTEE
jgi:hypothetical protein